MAEGKDVFCNQAYLAVTESAANTLTFEKLLTGVSIYEKVAWVISRLDYVVSLNTASFAQDQDAIRYGLSTSDQISTVGQSANPCIDVNTVIRVDVGTAGSGDFKYRPYSKSFSDLPGGGLLVPPNPLYIYVEGVGQASAQTVTARMFYTVKSLKVEDYWELVEMRHMIGA